jgi:hypothetical protein
MIGTGGKPSNNNACREHKKYHQRSGHGDRPKQEIDIDDSGILKYEYQH